MKDKECIMVEDLWPLYIDGEVSEETKEFVDNHIKTCSFCRTRKTEDLTGIDNLLRDNEKLPGDPERLIHRLKRRVQMITTIFLLGLVLIAGGTWYYGAWTTEKEYRQQIEREQEIYTEQLRALEEVSPPAQELFKRAGITFSKPEVTRAGEGLAVKYRFSINNSSGVEWLEEDRHWYNEDVLIDAQTGTPLKMIGGRGTGSKEGLEKRLETAAVSNDVRKVILKTKSLYAIMKPSGDPFRYKFAYDGSAKTLKVNEKYIFQGVEFSIDSLSLNEKEFAVKYRQLTPASEVGVYQLNFEFDDRLGNVFSSDPMENLVIKDPKEFAMNTPISPSKNWLLKINKVVQVIPGIKSELTIEGESQ